MSFSTSQIEEMIETLKAKQQAEEEVQKSIVDIVRDRLEDQWSRYAESSEEVYEISLEKYQKLVKLEFAIIESAKGFIPEEYLDRVANVFSKIRLSDKLQCMLSAYPSRSDDHSEEEKQELLKIRNVMKLLSNTYRYNRDLLFNKPKHNHSTYKSNIRLATACSQCGETAKKIFDNMVATGAVKLP